MGLRALGGARIFTQLDLNSAFHQIPLAEESRKLTAFVTPTGRHLEYNCISFGLKTAMQGFSRALDVTLAGLKFNDYISFVDDLIVYAENLVIHKQRLGKTLRLLRNAGFTIKLPKCVFAADSVTFLGFRVDAIGFLPAASMIEKINQLGPPKTLTDVKSIMGVVQYVRKHVPHFSHKTKIICDLTKKGAQFIWSTKHEQALDELKTAISTKPVLKHFDSKLPILLYSDASLTGLGGCLMQLHDDGEHPIGYFSRALTPPEANYAIFDLEITAAWANVIFFNDILENYHFTLVVDNAAVSTLLKNKNFPCRHRGPGKQLRQEVDQRVRNREL